MSHEEQLAICLEKWKQFDKHNEESISVRDRLKTVEMKVDLLEKQVLKNAIIGGMIGALVGSGASPAIMQIVDVMFKVHG